MSVIEFCVLLHLNQIQHSLNDSEVTVMPSFEQSKIRWLYC